MKRERKREREREREEKNVKFNKLNGMFK